jgi:hypothetical protein
VAWVVDKDRCAALEHTWALVEDGRGVVDSFELAVDRVPFVAAAVMPDMAAHPCCFSVPSE